MKFKPNARTTPQNASRDFAASVAALPPADAARAAGDASGSRALEALLLGPAAPEAKKQLLGKLAGSWGRVALKAPGSFLVEKAYGWGVSALGCASLRKGAVPGLCVCCPATAPSS
jgi:hypothetical protein